MHQRSESVNPWHPGAALIAWFFPGAGHLYLHQKKRGMAIALAIGMLWMGGFFVGGISVFDYHQHRAWFVGQMLIAPSIVVATARQNYLVPSASESDVPKTSNTPNTLERPPYLTYTPSFGRTSEIGVLYTALAGLLNLLAMLDVLYRPGFSESHPENSTNHSTRFATNPPENPPENPPAGHPESHPVKISPVSPASPARPPQALPRKHADKRYRLKDRMKMPGGAL